MRATRRVAAHTVAADSPSFPRYATKTMVRPSGDSAVPAPCNAVPSGNSVGQLRHTGFRVPHESRHQTRGDHPQNDRRRDPAGAAPRGCCGLRPSRARPATSSHATRAPPLHCPHQPTGQPSGRRRSGTSVDRLTRARTTAANSASVASGSMPRSSRNSAWCTAIVLERARRVTRRRPTTPSA